MTELEQNNWPCGTKICMFYENQYICFRKKVFWFLSYLISSNRDTCNAHRH